MNRIHDLVRPHLRHLKPYSSARDEFSGEARIFLDANENPFPSPYNRYPDPHQQRLRQKLSALKGVQPNQLFLGNGSDEAIDLLLRIYCEPGRDRVIIPQPTYGMYGVSAAINGIDVIPVPLTRDFDLDTTTVREAFSSADKMLFLCSPNNPSGNLLNGEKVAALIEAFPGIVVVDEAYIDFAESESWVTKLNDLPNLVVLQTLSKAWGLAGIRLGMAFASADIIAWLNRIKPPYNISTAAQEIALASISKGFPHEQVELLKQQRNELRSALACLAITEQIFPSDANFVLVRVKDADSLYQRLLERGVVVRNRSNVMWCENCLRITVGTPAENQHLIEQLKAV